MKKSKQSVAAILKRIEMVEYELGEIRKAIAESMTPTVAECESPEEVTFTMDDLCEAFGKKHKAYAARLRNALVKQGVTTFSQFLAMTPGQLLALDGIGPGTLQYANKAMKKLGVSW